MIRESQTFLIHVGLHQINRVHDSPFQNHLAPIIDFQLQFIWKQKTEMTTASKKTWLHCHLRYYGIPPALSMKFAKAPPLFKKIRDDGD